MLCIVDERCNYSSRLSILPAGTLVFCHANVIQKQPVFWVYNWWRATHTVALHEVCFLLAFIRRQARRIYICRNMTFLPFLEALIVATKPVRVDKRWAILHCWHKIAYRVPNHNEFVVNCTSYCSEWKWTRLYWNASFIWLSLFRLTFDIFASLYWIYYLIVLFDRLATVPPPRREKPIKRTCIVERLWSEYKEIWKINREKLAITEGAEISKKHIDTDRMKWTYNSIK